MPFRHWRLAWSALESGVLCFSPLRREWLPAPLWLCSDWWTPGSPQWWTGWVVDLGAPAPLHRLHPDYSTTDVKIDTEIQSNATWRQTKNPPNISPWRSARFSRTSFTQDLVKSFSVRHISAWAEYHFAIDCLQLLDRISLGPFSLHLDDRRCKCAAAACWGQAVSKTQLALTVCLLQEQNSTCAKPFYTFWFFFFFFNDRKPQIQPKSPQSKI